ncbi:MAG: hypothetical protein LBH35_09180 [Treponema sp.]|jgi:hypothetical protein|nr:hypothetical protein [Treponema sp.]
MKKLAILFLLTTVLAAFTFAQVSVTGGLDLKNLGEGNDGDRDIILYTDFIGSAKTELGPGSIGAELSLGVGLSFRSWDTGTGVATGTSVTGASTLDSAVYGNHGDVYVKGFYNLPAGPGTLGFGITAWNSFGALDFDVGYTGIAAGPATLGVNLTYGFNTVGYDSSFTAKPFADSDAAGQAPDVITAKVSADFAFGLGLVYKFQYVIADTSFINEIAYLDVNYKLLDNKLTVGAELSGTAGSYTDSSSGDIKQGLFGSGYDHPLGYAGITLKPYAEYAITDNVVAGAFFKVQRLGTDKDKNPNTKGDAWGIEFSPGIWVKYTF